MNFQVIWKKSKKALALLLAITLFFGGWGNYDFSVFASGELTVKLDNESEVYTGSTISLPGVTSVKNGDADVTSYTSSWTDSEGNEVSGTVTDAGTYILTVKETATETVTDPDTGEEKEDTKETGRDGAAIFTVEKLNIGECAVTADAATYTGAAITPQNVKVTNKDGAEVASSLYTAECSNNTNAGDATITVTAITGNANVVENSSQKGTFKINKIDLSGSTVTLHKDSTTYIGTAIEPTVVVTLGNVSVDANFYKVEYANNTNAGTATVTVKPADGNGNITGSKEKTFTITAKALTDAMIEISPTGETVTGDNFKDVVNVVVKDTINGVETTLAEGTDYEVDVPDMVEGKSYEIKVSGKGNYTGTIAESFKLDYAQDGTAELEGLTLTASAYADTVTVKPADGYQIAEAVTGETFVDSITYTATPDDYVVYIRNADGEITEFTLPKFTVDTDVPTLSVDGPEADSAWAPSKDITVNVTGADYGVFYTTTKQELVSPITQAPTGMIKLSEGQTTLTIIDSIFEDTTYYFYAIDNAGHVATAEAVVNQVEKEVPILTLGGNDDKKANDGVYWKSNDDLEFTVEAKDQEKLSGLKEIIVEGLVTDGLSCTFTEGAASAAGKFTIKEAGTYTLKAVDVAGNESVVTTIVVKEDTKAPEVVLAEPAGADRYKDTTNNEYWFSAETVNLSFAITDETGIDETELAPYTVVYATDANFTDASEVEVNANEATVPVILAAGNDGKNTYYFKVADKAGNVGTVQRVTVGYDATQPKITEVVLTQLNGDEWINLEEAGAAQPNETKVAFSVTAVDAESGVQKIQYRSGSNAAWQDADCTENNGVYTFVTNETYADGVDYVWEVRVADNVTADMENAPVKAAKDGKIDTTAPSTTAYIKFISDTEGANDVNRGTVTDGKWSSNIYEMATAAWNKIWGKETIKFEVYVQDATSGINSIAMSYDGSNIEGLTKVDGVQAFTTGNGEAKEGYIVYEGSLTYKSNDGLAVQNFQIDTLTDIAGNTSGGIVLGNAGEDIIYLDNVAPKLVSVQIEESKDVFKDVVTDPRYLYKETKSVVLTVEERFFAQENIQVYPDVTLKSRSFGETFAAVEADYIWTNKAGTTQWYTTIELPLNAGKEMEYQITMTYDDPSGNSLATDANLGVKDGQFESKIFVIDDVAPEFLEYTVNNPTQYTIEGAAVYKNKTSEDDLEVTFKIDDNPDDYEKAKENLKVTLFKNNQVEKEMYAKDLSVTLPNKINPREYTYSFAYDGNSDTEDVFHVTVEYQDALGHLMEDAEETVTTGTMGDDGIFTSKNYVIDHVAPKLAAVQIDNQRVVTRDRYFYAGSQVLSLTVNEKFFGKEDGNPVYPNYTLHKTIIDVNGESNTETTTVTTRGAWENNGNEYTLNVPLDPVVDQDNPEVKYEVEYQIELSYADAAGNVLVNGEEIEGVDEAGKFKSKIFVIDQLAPEFVDYSVTTTDCDVQKASVLLNNTAETADDLVVNFTINDNPTYYENKGEDNNHAMSKANLIINLYKEDGTVIDTLRHVGEKLVGDKGKVIGEKVEVNGREHSYALSYDGEDTTQDIFYVTVEYKDVVEHQMVDGRTEKVNRADGAEDSVDENGMYTSEKYIIDHVAPEFGITYSAATNVVEGTRSHDVSKKVASGKSPLKGYTAYYNKDIDVTLTFDEKYINVMKAGKPVDCDNDSKDPLDHFTFAITKNGKELADNDIPEITWSHNGTEHTATFTIKALADQRNDGDYQFVITYQDCALNLMDVTAASASNELGEDVVGEYKSPILVMDTTAPVLEEVAYDTINLFNTVKERDYVSKETNMTFTITEHNPTLTSGYSITTDGEKTATWTINGDVSTTTLDTVEMRNAKGDEQTVTMYIEDWAGNKVVLANDDVRRSKNNTSLADGTFTDKFTVDTVVPEIQLEYVTYTPNRPNVDGIDYFKNPITVKVTVDEHNFDQDLFKQPVVKTDKNVAYKESGWSTSGDIHVKTFTFSADNQYDLSIIGTDNAKNKLKLKDAADMAEKLDAANSKVSVSVAVDSTIPAIGDNVKPIIVIKPATPQNETIDGQALYNTDVTYEVVVYDPLLNDYASGINDITFKVNGEDGTAATCEVNKQGSISNGSGVTVKRVGGDVADLARGADNKYTFNVTISSTIFNTNGIVLWVGANDVATTHNEKEVAPIAIDITKPKVVVSYDNNDVSNEKYFHDVRTATVTVTERNFSDDCLKFIVNGGDKELDFSLSSAGSGNRDNAVWVAHYTFGADSDYTVDVEVKDRAQNVGSVDYVGEAPQEFTIDMIKPKISVEYDNNSVLNELYYKEARTATITIEEHNFDADDVIIELTAKDGGSPISTPGVSSWSSDGDYHRATIHYNYDGEFTFDIDFMDLATNEADDYDMDHFIVDLTAPELEIFDIEHMSANNGVVRPGVRYWDTNYDADGTVVVMTGYNNGIVEMTGKRDITANGVEFKLDDFEYVQSMDDIYTMNATVYDLAGNSSEATVMFSVNRFGSVYTFDKETDALIGENGKYYTNKEQQLVITETNVDTLEFKEITLNLNGKLVTLKEGVDFTVSVDGNDSTWKQYTYKISEKNFVEEGTYILTIYSEDRATNTSDNNSKGKKIEFVVDKTNPSLLISGVENAGQYRTSNKEVLIDVEDNVRLSKVVVTVDGVEVAVFNAAQIDEANGRLSVGINDASDWQLVEVTAYDAAGNVYSHEQMKVLVSANIFVQWYRNTPVFWGGIGGTAALAGLLWWFLVGKKKKKEDEEQQVK